MRYMKKKKEGLKRRMRIKVMVREIMEMKFRRLRQLQAKEAKDDEDEDINITR